MGIVCATCLQPLKTRDAIGFATRRTQKQLAAAKAEALREAEDKLDSLVTASATPDSDFAKGRHNGYAAARRWLIRWADAAEQEQRDA